MPEIRQEVLGERTYHMDVHTVKLHLALSKKLSKIIITNKKCPLPVAKYIVSLIAAHWNQIKGSINVMSRYLSNVKIPFGPLSPKVVYVILMVKMLMMNAFLTHRYLSNLDILVNSSCLKMGKQQLSEIMTFREP